MDVMFPLLAHDMLRKAVLLGAAWAGLPADGGAPGPDGLPAWADGAGLRVLSLEGGAVAKLLSESGHQGLSFWRPSPLPSPAGLQGETGGLTPRASGSGWPIVALHTGSRCLLKLRCPSLVTCLQRYAKKFGG